VQADSQPDESFQAVEPDLEDVYFVTMLGAGRSAEADEAEVAAGAAS